MPCCIRSVSIPDTWATSNSMAERLCVGMLAPIAWRAPPLHYGPWERVVSRLTEGLVAGGADVTLFATADSVTRARLSSVAPHGYAEDPLLDAKVYESLHVALRSNRPRVARSTSCTTISISCRSPMRGWRPLPWSPPHPWLLLRAYPACLRAYNDVCHLVAISAADRHPDLDDPGHAHHTSQARLDARRDQQLPSLRRAPPRRRLSATYYCFIGRLVVPSAPETEGERGG
jgi:hypothetical protein